ncbi:hypothetical protein AGR1A_Cc50333 [Agrobacterium fabacearum CFBP 5771]|nr:hypothetical protein AGR1B_Cc10266 [Agrobacterium fabacearum S56]CUW93969.1 hypothetical protein AGR1C_Cc50338 [Agrobacterium fabacearum TT111]CVI18426.1 hypothetical protein AGR1A_Cc50333 [Agrobacterium fabacearum CFBP 5771]
MWQPSCCKHFPLPKPVAPKISAAILKTKITPDPVGQAFIYQIIRSKAFKGKPFRGPQTRAQAGPRAQECCAHVRLHLKNVRSSVDELS